MQIIEIKSRSTNKKRYRPTTFVARRKNSQHRKNKKLLLPKVNHYLNPSNIDDRLKTIIPRSEINEL